MTSFVHTHYPEQHPGVQRFHQAGIALKRLAGGLDGGRGLAALLLAALVSALLVVANQVIAWSDGNLLAAWVALWVIAFAGLAVFAAPMRKAARSLRASMRAYSARRRQAMADDKLWHLALNDARVMADISRAMTRDAERSIRGYY